MSPAQIIRPARPQTTMRVIRTERISEHLVRVIAGGDGFATNAFTDRYIKIRFGEVTRTYTVRQVGDGWISVDFVVHGDTGIAGPWALAAQAGDELTFGGPGGAFAPDATADWYLFAGDLSALPAIASSLEALDDTAVGTAIIEVDSPDDRIELVAPAGVEIRWIPRTEHPSTALADQISELDWREGRVQVFAHGEREAMKAIRPLLLQEHALPREQVSLSGYWAFGRTEDRFQAEKREPIGVV